MLFFRSKPKNICFGNNMLYRGLLGSEYFAKNLVAEGEELKNYLVFDGFTNISISTDSSILSRCTRFDPAPTSVLVLEGGGTATTKFACPLFVFGTETRAYGIYTVEVKEYDTKQTIFKVSYNQGDLNVYDKDGNSIGYIWVGALNKTSFAISIKHNTISLYCANYDADYDTIVLNYTQNKPLYVDFTGVKPSSSSSYRDDIYIYFINHQSYFRQINS